MVGLALVAAVLLVTDPNPSETEPSVSKPVVLEAVLDSGITSSVADYLIDAIREAEARDAAALVIRVDTPGGLMDATRELVQTMLAAKVPVIVYVAPAGARAGSAGTFITLAAHVAAMAPASSIGAAHPVAMFGGDIEGEMARKVENDAAAWARSLALTHGRNPDWAEKAVRESEAIPAEEAYREGVVDLLAPNLTGLLDAIDGRTVQLAGVPHVLETHDARVEPYAMSGPQRVVKWLSNPNLLYMLLLGGLFLLFLEFKNPGLIVPGVVGGLLLALVLGLQILPVNWLGVLLILGAAALFILEIYVTSFGALAAGGLACLIVGSYLLFDVEGSTFQVDAAVIWSVAIAFSILLVGIGYLLLRVKQQGATSGVESMVGEHATVYAAIAPDAPGRIHLRGAYWTATATIEIPKDAEVRVTAVNGTVTEVEPIEP